MKKELNRSPSISELAEALEVSKEEIISALEVNKTPSSIYQTIYTRSADSELYLIDSIGVEGKEGGLDTFDRLELVEVIRNLEPRARKIIFMRYFEDKTQQEVAEEIGVSQVQVSRLERSILEELRKSI